jgi:hypothetical protein
LEEIWKDISGYEGFYQVSNFGRVRSLDRKVNHYLSGTKIFRGQIIKSHPNHGGYLMVPLCKKRKRALLQIHRLVALAFIPNTDNKPCVNHLDADRQNNAVENLQWCTHLENVRHSMSIGNFINGEAHHKSVLTAKNVRDIRGRGGDRVKEIASDYGVTIGTIYAIRQNRIWKNIL